MTTIKPKRTVDITISHIRKKILTGEYPPESRLPPERKLAEDLGINRLTLRSALSHLAAEGLVLPKHGQGIIVLDYRKFGSIELMAHIEDDVVLNQLFTLRRSFAAEAAALASENASPKEISRLRSIARRQEDEQDPRKFLEGDLEFTHTMVQSSKSLPLILLFNSMERITRAQPKLPMAMLENRKQACSSYKALIALIRNRDPALIRKAILGYLNEEDQKKLQLALSKD